MKNEKSICKKADTKDLQANDSTKTKVLQALVGLPKGKAVSRYELSSNFDISERLVRKAVEDLRREGYPIMSTSHSKGYKLMENIKEFEVFKRETLSRVNKMLVQINSMEERMAGHE